MSLETLVAEVGTEVTNIWRAHPIEHEALADRLSEWGRLADKHRVPPWVVELVVSRAMANAMLISDSSWLRNRLRLLSGWSPFTSDTLLTRAERKELKRLRI